MPAKSEPQARLFRMALACKRGRPGPWSREVRELAASMPEEKLREFTQVEEELVIIWADGLLESDGLTVDISLHAQDRMWMRDGQWVGIDRAEVEELVRKGFRELVNRFGTFRTFVLHGRRSNLNVVCALAHRGSQWVAKVVTVMRKKFFKPKPGDGFVEVYESEEMWVGALAPARGQNQHTTMRLKKRNEVIGESAVNEGNRAVSKDVSPTVHFRERITLDIAGSMVGTVRTYEDGQTGMELEIEYDNGEGIEAAIDAALRKALLKHLPKNVDDSVFKEIGAKRMLGFPMGYRDRYVW